MPSCWNALPQGSQSLGPQSHAQSRGLGEWPQAPQLDEQSHDSSDGDDDQQPERHDDQSARHRRCGELRSAS